MSRVLVDADCVVVDFNAGFAELYEDVTGEAIALEDMLDCKHEDLLSRLGRMDVLQQIGDRMRSPGFCASLEPLPGAASAITDLRKRHEVHFVTKPLSRAPFWKAEREAWLIQHMGVDERDITFTHKKNIVAGHFLIDDVLGNLRKWYAEHTGGVPILYPAPHNKHMPHVKGITRVSGWEEVLELIG